MKFFRTFCTVFLTAFIGCISAKESLYPMILEYVENMLPHFGTLKNSEGFVYVDVDDAYIHKLISFIQGEGFEEPPYFGGNGLVGAHISVIFPDEMRKFGIEAIDECGETIYFTPKWCEVVHPPKSKVDQVFIIVVQAPVLDQIRVKYGLPKRVFEFHITLGVKPSFFDNSPTKPFPALVSN